MKDNKTKYGTTTSMRFEDYYFVGLEMLRLKKVAEGIVGLSRTDLIKEALAAYFKEQGFTPDEIHKEVEKQTT